MKNQADRQGSTNATVAATSPPQRALRRRIIREKVVQALYAYELSGDSLEHVFDTILPPLEENKPGLEFAKKLIAKTAENRVEFDRVIRGKLNNWDFKRVALLDRIILRMGICELLHFKEIPPKVSMNEAIELAKLFSTSRSAKFVNGVLDAVLNDIRRSGTLSKTGRGLDEGHPQYKWRRATAKKR
ncbi:MAG TPA: transcription antitermination factor NusB [Bacteroidota bacterium]|nr:transcription antitermination factor NusB [Bacteroidota bacterium]